MVKYLIIQKYKIAYVSSAISKNSSTIDVYDSTLFSVDDHIIIDWNSKQSGKYSEQRNIIKSISGNTLTLRNKNLFSYSKDTPIVVLGSNIQDSCACTQNILINNEWYTKVFYKGPNCIDIDYNSSDSTTEYYKEGVACFTKYSSREVEIIGMKGIQFAQNSLNETEYSSLLTDRKLNKNTILDNSYNIDSIKPFVNGTYKIVPNIIQDNIDYLMTDYYNLEIKGSFDETSEIFETTYKWNNSNSTNINYNCILIKGKYMGYGGVISFKKKLLLK